MASSRGRRAAAASIGAFLGVALASCAQKEARVNVGAVSSGLTASAAPSDDSFINALHPDNNNGASASLFTGKDGQGGLMRALVRFGVPAAVQQGRVTVSNVRLTMTLRAVGTGGAGTAAVQSLRAVTEPWAQGNGVSDVQGSYVIGQTCSAAVSGVTWKQSSCVGAPGSGTSWSVAGGAVAGTTSGLVDTTGVAVNGAVSWDSGSAGNAGMVADVQAWIDDPTTNRGWRISSSSESGVAASVQRFYSSEAGASNAPTLAITYACKSPFRAVSSGCTTCTTAAETDCVVAQGNTCVDPGPPSTAYSCSCSNAAYVAGTGGDGKPACVDKNDCAPNHCTDGGDASATCTDRVAPVAGYDCHCGPSFKFNGVTCVNDCISGSDPCGNGGTCTVSGAGWTCSCPAGYVSSGGAEPSCTNLNACDAAANAACATSAGNTCVDDPPPSLGYHCACGAAYVAGSGPDGKATCIDEDACTAGRCTDDGDSAATCSDRPAPATGYDCACSSGFRFDGSTCRDVDECSRTPCAPGSCSNTRGSYACACPAGYATTGGPAPACAPAAGGADASADAGTAPAAGGSGCSCAFVAARAKSPAALLGALVALAWRRRRARGAAARR